MPAPEYARNPHYHAQPHVGQSILRIAIIVIACFYVATLKGSFGNKYPGGSGNDAMVMNTPPFETSMERGRYVQILSLAKNGTLQVDEYKDMLRPDIAWYNGHYYPPFPPGVAIASTPVYILGSSLGFGQISATITTSIVSLLAAYLTMLVAVNLGFSALVAALSGIIYALATCAFPYSVSLSAHPFSALSAILLLYLFLRTIDNFSLKILLILWATWAGQLFIDYPNLAILAVFPTAATLRQIWLAFTTKRIRLFCSIIASSSLGLLLVLLPYIFFSIYHYQTPVAFTNTYNLKPLQNAGIPIDEAKLTNNIFLLHTYSNRFELERLAHGAYTLLASPDRGVFMYSPILLFVIPGIFVMFSKYKMVSLLLLISWLANIIVYGSFDDPWGGWGFGPRYHIVTLPFLALISIFGFKKWSKYKIVRFFLGGLLIVSIAIHLLGALTTNAVPPSIEGDYIGLKSNYLYNLDYLYEHGSTSWIYNAYVSKMATPAEYGALLLALSIGGVLILVQAQSGMDTPSQNHPVKHKYTRR